MFAASKTDSASTGGYQISRSLRFNSADSAYLNRTPASASNQKTWTWSGWVKRSKLGSAQTLMSQGETYIDLNGSDQVEINLRTGGTNYFLGSTAVYRDPSAWYHIVVVCDTTNATASDRLKLWVNNVQVTSYVYSSYTSIPQNQDTGFNAASVHRLGSSTLYGEYLGGYMTEVNFIDGQALTPSSFGETNAQTGVWQPKAYSGSYGTNGFYLNFSDNSNTTAATLGKDYSGNGNNWTPNNFSVTAGAGNDSLVDSPTSYGTSDTGIGGEIRGNYATLNPLNTTGGTISNGNLDYTMGNTRVAGNFAMSSGSWYFEVKVASVGSTVGLYTIGLAGAGTYQPNGFASGFSAVFYYALDGSKYVDGTSSAYGSSYGSGDLIGVAVNATAGTVTFYKNNTSQGSITLPASSSGWVLNLQSASSLTDVVFNCNFGQRPFAYTAPSGFKALCTQNLPTPTIGATTATLANKYFEPTLYTGTNANLTVTNSGGFQPDFIWIKLRSSAGNHVLANSIGGPNKVMYSSQTTAEETSNAGTGITAITSTGFTLGTELAGTSYGSTNYNTYAYVAWNWKANGSGSTNTAGSITSTVSANTTSGFSIVTWTGTGADASIGHGLGVVPSMVIHKFRSAISNWSVYTSTTGAGKRLKLNSSDAVATDGSFPTTPTSTVFYINGGSNDNGVTMVAYCFAPIAGYSAFGSYTGNGSTDGPFVYTGFKPAYVMVKITNDTADWAIHDVARNTYNVVDNTLLANLSDAEYTSNGPIDIVANGFKIRTTNPNWNVSSLNYIYICFASNPFKTSLAR